MTAVGADPGQTRPTDRRTFRWMNEQVREVQRDWPMPVYDLICECSDPRCLRVLTVERSVYEGIVSDANRFVVIPGHEQAAHERIVDVGLTHVVVQPYEVVEDSVWAGISDCDV